jgi:hypothetical protein
MGPGRYEAHFATPEVGAYLINLTEYADGKPRASQAIGASVNYSPEFQATEPNLHLLRRLAETGGGRLLQPVGKNPPETSTFLHQRERTFQPRDLWEWLFRVAVLLFVADVGVRRIYLDRAEWLKATQNLRRWIFFWQGKPRTAEADESLSALLTKRTQVRAGRTAAGVEPRPELFKPTQAAKPLAGATAAAKVEEPFQPAEATPPPAPKEGVYTPGRLLDAKKRAGDRLRKS